MTGTGPTAPMPAAGASALRKAVGAPAAHGGVTLGDVGELGVLDAIMGLLPEAGPEVQVGPGDDAAVSTPGGALVSTTDMLVEGEDFLPEWTDPFRLGIKAAAQNLADVHAMGARPHGLLITIGAPADTRLDFVTALMSGFAAEAGRGGAPVLGGDLSGGPVIIISVTAFGVLDDTGPVLRSGARPGDAIVLAGTVGRAAAGLDLLLAEPGLAGSEPSDLVEGAPAEETQELAEGTQGFADGAVPGGAPAEETSADPALRALIDVQRSPQPNYAAARQIASQAHAMIDVSDGLAGDLGRIAAASHVTADLDPAALDALGEPLMPAAHRLGNGDAVRTWVLHGGEDHGFLATVDPSAVPVGWMRIGTCHGADGQGQVTVAGEPIDTRAFEHFG